MDNVYDNCHMEIDDAELQFLKEKLDHIEDYISDEELMAVYNTIGT